MDLNMSTPTINWNSDDLPTTFRLFRQRCELYFSVKNIAIDKQVDHILLFSGDDGIRIFNSWTLTDNERADPTVLFRKFQSQIEPKVNFRVQRFYLQKYVQAQDETVEQYMTRCKLQAQKCQFSEDEMRERLIEQLIYGTKINEVQKTLLQKDATLTLDQAMTEASTLEASITHMTELKGVCEQKTEINSFYREKHCGRCGGTHALHGKPCPAMGSTCPNCGGPNHWAKMCRSRKYRRKDQHPDRRRNRSRPRSSSRHGQRRQYQGQPPDQRHRHSVNTVGTEHLEEQLQALTFETIDVIDTASHPNNNNDDEVYASIDVNIEGNRPGILKVKVDTGAQGNILPLRLFEKMFPSRIDELGSPSSLRPTSTVLTAYNGTTIKQIGKHTMICGYKGQCTNTEFFVVETSGPAIMGLPSCRQLGLVTLHCGVNKKVIDIPDKQTLINAYPDRFEGIGNFKGTYHITVDDSVCPVIHAQRKCPINLKDDIKRELDNMEDLKVITKVTEPTDWVSSLVYSRKSNGKLRICLDPKDLNKAIKRPHYKTPTLEEISHKFAGSTVFSKLDARHGYWSVSLDAESSRLTTFNSPFGRYRFLRLPFGLSLSQDVFQAKMDQILEECPGVVSITDDIAVHGKDTNEHDRNMQLLMERARENGIVFNPDKCEISMKTIKFFGLIFDSEGVHPDPDKVRAIKAIPNPQNVKQLQEFLGIATYMSPFITHLSDATAPLRELIKKDTPFDWTASHDAAFNRVKDAICSETTLTYYDPSIDTVLRVDASSKGIGAVLLQRDKPVAFASKSLSQTEQRYANIEREMLAVVFGCNKFHTFLYGKRFVVQTDHKPLEMIHLKNLSAAPQRLQRMLLQVQPYDISIKYRPGRDMVVADALSRSPDEDNETIQLDVRVDFIHFSSEKIKSLRQSTQSDEILSSLQGTIIEGWPERQKQLPAPLRQYWSVRDELSIEDGIVLKGHCVVIPEVMRGEILEKLHDAHLGVEKTKLRAKQAVYWPGIQSDIENLVARCHVCQMFQPSQGQEPLLQHELPTRPWQILGTDLFYMQGREFLIVCDYYSKFPIVRQMKNVSGSQGVINNLKTIFSEQGIPDKVISDNGPHYSSTAFKSFARDWGFDHITSSPHFPQSNGFIERQIQTIKRTLEKATLSKFDLDMAMLILRTTPIDHYIPSPAELLNTRKFRTNIPTKIDNRALNRDNIRLHLEERQAKQKFYHDAKSSCVRAPLVANQQIRTQDLTTGKWTQGTVVRPSQEPRSYIIQSPEGSILRRTRQHIRETPPVTTTTTPTSKQRHVHFEEQPTVLSNSETPVEDGIRTRSGRVVRPPKHLTTDFTK